MTEFKVWRAMVDWIEANDGQILGACPPGSSVYGYNKCCLIDTIAQKRDEPDIMFLLENDLILVECKPTLKGLITHNERKSNNESDVEKLLRIYQNFLLGKYNNQLLANYNLNISKLNIKLALNYAKCKYDPIFNDIRFIKYYIENNKINVENG